ncbi:MAG: hypothetical protein K2X93_17205 [Candidatus Obscuribacterales bacterium]|nr:hypothetical protein [Candidatus Obscuribacterales bacterium]
MLAAATKRNREPRYRLGELFLEAGIISPIVLNNSLLVARRTSMPLGRVLIMSGHVSELDIECALKTQGSIRAGSIDAQLAKELLRFAHVHQVTIDEAYRLNGLSRDLGPLSRLGKLVLAAGVVNEDDLSEAVQYAQDTGYPLGLSLVHLGFIEESTLTICINLQILLRDRHLHFNDAVKALKFIIFEGETFEGLLHALGLQGDGDTKPAPKVGELLVAAKLLSHEDSIVLAELSTEKDLQYGEMVAGTYNLVRKNVVDAALRLQKMFNSPMFTIERAARLLHLVNSMNTTLEQVLVEFDVLEQVVTLLRAAELLDEGILRETAASINNFEMSVPEALIMRHAISATQARMAVMCLSQIQAGTMTYEEALGILNNTSREEESKAAVVAA